MLCTSLLALWQSIVRRFYLNLQENPRKMLLLRLVETSMEKKEDPLFFLWSFNILLKLYFEKVQGIFFFKFDRIVMKLTPVILACEYSRLPSPVGMFRKRDVCVSEPKVVRSELETTVFPGYGCLFFFEIGNYNNETEC